MTEFGMIETEIKFGKANSNIEGNYSQALYHFKEALQLANSENRFDLISHILSRIGVVYKTINQYKEALQYLQQAVQSDQITVEDTLYSYRHLAELHVSLNTPETALELLQRCSDILDSHNVTPNHYGQVLSSIAGIYLHMADYPSAIEYLHRSLEQYRKGSDAYNEMRTLGNLANACNLHHDWGKAREYCSDMLRMVTLPDTGAGPYDHGQANMVAASIYLESVDLVQAQRYAEAALQIGQSYNLNQILAMALEMLMAVHTKRGELDKAISFGLQAEEIGIQISRKFRLVQIYRRLAEAYQQQKDFRAAYMYLEKYTSLRDEIVNEEKQRTIAEMQARFDFEKSEQERKRLEGELSTFAANEIEKRELLSSMVSSLKKVANVKDIQGIIREIETVLNKEPEWAVFDRQFAYIQRDFLPALTTKYPTLTPVEIKVCAFTRLNLETKQIAALLSIDPRTVQNHRLNIRRKLGISGKVNLLNFLASLSV